MTKKSSSKFSIIIDTANSEFEDYGVFWTIAAILCDTAKRLQMMEEDGPVASLNMILWDHNGNRVGHARL
jgi:hypothetical protein